MVDLLKSSFWSWLTSQRVIWLSLLVLGIAIALTAWFSPADVVLGDTVKLVYVHGAIIQAALLSFGAAGVLGLGYLLTNTPPAFEWSQAAERAGLVLWALYMLTSAAVMILAWGGIAWFEPRWVFGLQVLVAAPLAHWGGSLMRSRRLVAWLNVVVAGVVLVLLYRARLVMHPSDPVGTSPSANIKGAFNILFALWVLAAAQLTHAMYRLAHRREMVAERVA